MFLAFLPFAVRVVFAPLSLAQLVMNGTGFCPTRVGVQGTLLSMALAGQTVFRCCHDLVIRHR
jgi:hypothetical protein